MVNTALTELRLALQERFADALPLGQGVAPVVGTGLGPLDRALPGGGLARGRVTLWEPGGGATALLRSACRAAVARGERAAWVDGAGQMATGEWDSGVLLLRPASEVTALVCAEELLRCGGFGLVVLAGGGRSAGGEAVRLGRAARVGGSAFVLVAAEASVAHMRVRSQIRPQGYRWREGPFGEPVAVTSSVVEVAARSLGWSGRVEVELGVQEHAVRLSPEPRLVDRRGAVAGRSSGDFAPGRNRPESARPDQPAPEVRWRRVVRERERYATSRGRDSSLPAASAAADCPAPGLRQAVGVGA